MLKSRPENSSKLEASLTDYFASWLQGLNLAVESTTADSVTLRMPQNDQLARPGGMLCGQAMMAAADTAMVLALIHHFGELKPCSTVQMSTSFMRPLSHQDALVQARLVRVGKTMAFGEIDICGADDGKSVCRSSVTYALM